MGTSSQPNLALPGNSFFARISCSCQEGLGWRLVGEDVTLACRSVSLHDSLDGRYRANPPERSTYTIYSMINTYIMYSRTTDKYRIIKAFLSFFFFFSRRISRET